MKDWVEPGASNARWRPEVNRCTARHPIDDRLRSADLGDQTRGRKERKQAWMTPCVVLDAVSAFNHLADQGGMLLNQSADAEKAGLGAVLVEDIEYTLRELRVWAVVKGQGHRPRPIFTFRHPCHVWPEDSAPGEKPSDYETRVVRNHRPNCKWPYGWIDDNRPKSQEVHCRGCGNECGGAIWVAGHDPILIVGSLVPLGCRFHQPADRVAIDLAARVSRNLINSHDSSWDLVRRQVASTPSSNLIVPGRFARN